MVGMNPDQVRLEAKITFVEKTVSDLNEVVYAQQQELVRLRAAIVRLEERLAEGGPGDGPLPYVKPPHY